jgi:hypothetical protein
MCRMQQLRDQLHEGQLPQTDMEIEFRSRLLDTRLQLQELAEVYG